MFVGMEVSELLLLDTIIENLLFNMLYIDRYFNKKDLELSTDSVLVFDDN